MVVELIDWPSSISSQFAKIGWVILIHFFGKTDIVVATYAASLILAEKNWPLVFSNCLVVLGKPALVSFEVDEGVFSRIERSINGHFPLIFIEAHFIQNAMH